VGNNLPKRIDCWAAAYCPGSPNYPYRPPAGYNVTKCTQDGTATHGGCAGCVMSEVEVVCGKDYGLEGQSGNPTVSPKTFAMSVAENVCALLSPIRHTMLLDWMCR
jgi:hypothetical protein